MVGTLKCVAGVTDVVSVHAIPHTVTAETEGNRNSYKTRGNAFLSLFMKHFGSKCSRYTQSSHTYISHTARFVCTLYVYTCK